MTDNYILDFYDDITLKYEDILLMYWTTILAGRNGKTAKSLVVITNGGEYNIIKEKNPNVLEGLSKENVKK